MPHPADEHRAPLLGDEPDTESWSGHTVVQVPVPPLEEWVRGRTAFYDDAFVSTDPRFAHAHVTVLAPWVPSPARVDLEWLSGLARSTPAFDVTLERVEVFPDGVIHLVPEPDRPLGELTERVAAAYPDHPPYGGRFGAKPDPHVTLDRVGPDVGVDSTRAAVAHLLPARLRVDRLQLTWWVAGGCHVIDEWALSG